LMDVAIGNRPHFPLYAMKPQGKAPLALQKITKGTPAFPVFRKVINGSGT
jgi:hypothetical protein